MDRGAWRITVCWILIFHFPFESDFQAYRQQTPWEQSPRVSHKQEWALRYGIWRNNQEWMSQRIGKSKSKESPPWEMPPGTLHLILLNMWVLLYLLPTKLYSEHCGYKYRICLWFSWCIEKLVTTSGQNICQWLQCWMSGVIMEERVRAQSKSWGNNSALSSPATRSLSSINRLTPALRNHCPFLGTENMTCEASLRAFITDKVMVYSHYF